MLYLRVLMPLPIYASISIIFQIGFKIEKFNLHSDSKEDEKIDI